MRKTTGDLAWPLIGRQADIAMFDRWLADPCTHGIVLRGPQGVGKSRLAAEFAQRAATAGFVVGRAVATAVAAAVPLGAIAHLLPDNEARHGNGRIVLIDDAHLLDRTSARLLCQLMDARAARVVATVCTDTGWLTADTMTPLDVHPLDDEAVEELLRDVLAGPVARRAVRMLYRVSEGNPLYLREIVTGALRSGALEFTGDLWQLDESCPLGTPMLADLVERRLHTVGPAARGVLDVLALCGPQSPANLAPGLPAELAAAGLVRVLRDGQRDVVTLAHPVYGEVVRERIPRLLRAEILLSQAERLRRRGAARRQDALHIATWELAATGTSDPALLRQAAGLAFHANDNCHVTELLTALPRRHHTTSTRLLLGQAHFLLGRWPEAESEFAAAAGGDTERLTVSGYRVTNLLCGNADATAARAVNDAVRRRVGGAAGQAVLALNEAMALLVSRRPAAALDLLDTVGADPDLSAYQGARLRHATCRAAALAMLGRASHAVEEAERIHASTLSSHPSAHGGVLVHALTETGRLTDAVRVGRAAFDDLVAAALPTPRLWLVVLIGRAEWLAGHLRSALRWFTEAVSLGQYLDHLGAVRMACSGLAACHALLGDLPAAQAALDLLASRPAQPSGLLAVGEEKLGEAWLLAARGRLVPARDVLTGAARDARRSGHVGSEALLLTDVARLGGARDVTDRLAALAVRDDGNLGRIRARFADGLARTDAEHLCDTAVECAALGVDLLAAEAFTMAAGAWRRAGDRLRSTAAAGRADTSLARCQDVRTPLLGAADVAVALTDREREIALFAVGTQVSSRDIADALHISVRTVDNHLQRIYWKLGITNRRALAQALG